MKIVTFIFFTLWGSIQAMAQTIDPDVVPVGWDAYKMWTSWPLQRMGVRAYMRSTYDRTGGNETADASHFLFMQQEDYNVTLDVEGAGYLYFIRTNHWHGSPWRYVVDGNDYMIKETGTSDPVHAKKCFSKTNFIPEAPFTEPLAYTWSTTKGANLVWTPIGFNRSLQLAYGRTHYGTGYYIYHQFANPEKLSAPIKTWADNDAVCPEVAELINRSGTDIAPTDIERESGFITLNRERVTFATLNGARTLRALKFTLPLDKAVQLERIRLRITWDGRKEPSIDAPICLFFGAGVLDNFEHQEYLVKAFPVNIRYDYATKKVEMACYFPMPFFKSARFELADIDPQDTEVQYELRHEANLLPKNRAGYMHATYRDIPKPELGHDLVLLDTKGVEGSDCWSGNFVGTSLIFSHDGFLGTLEGDPRFFFDDSLTPQGQGTGTEEWCGGGDYWGGRNMTLPFVGHPCGKAPDRLDREIINDREKINSAYRFLLADLMPFGHRAEIHLEHGAENLSLEHYETVTYWYGLPAASLVLTDEINVGDIKDEKRHQYSIENMSDPYTVNSRYEWGIDSLPVKNWGKIDFTGQPNYVPGKEVYPAHEETGRLTTVGSQFTVKVDKNNHGVLLRRTLDYQYPNQRAEVYVADAHGGEWQYVGQWYTAGSNTCVFSNPRPELAKRQYKVETSNRRFRDDEFLIPARMTRGLCEMKIRVVFVPDYKELFPGCPFPQPNYWSEMKYKVYNYIEPQM